MIDTQSKFQLIVLVDTWRTDALSTLTFELDNSKGIHNIIVVLQLVSPKLLLLSFL